MRQIIATEKDRDALIKHVSVLPLGKVKYLAEVKVYRKKRSLPQNKLYWMWLRCISDETGNDEKALHEYFSSEFLNWEGSMIFGNYVAVRKSTAELDTKEFTDYLEQIKIKMAEQGIVLPEPGDFGWDGFYARYYEDR